MTTEDITELNESFREGLDNLWFERYNAAKNNFEYIIKKVDKIGYPTPSSRQLSNEIYCQQKLRSSFALGFAEEMAAKQGKVRYRPLDDLVKASKEFCKASKNWVSNDPEPHRQLGKSYASMGFKEEAMSVLTRCEENRHISLSYNFGGL